MVMTGPSNAQWNKMLRALERKTAKKPASADPASLEDRIAALEARVQALEKTIAKLTAKPAPVSRLL